MAAFYTEADYENSIIELFQNMGYKHVYGPNVDRDFNSPIYDSELETALTRLNPDNNSFIVANQWTYVENSNKRPDVLLFLNGLKKLLLL